MYEGTLFGKWEAIVTFQQLIVLANESGIVDMTTQSIAARTSIPIEILQKGIEILEGPDPFSRTPGNEGKRIELIDDRRPWGWIIVNYDVYKRLATHADKRKSDRERISDRRKANKINDVAKCRKVSQGVADVANVAYTDRDRDRDIKKLKQKKAVPEWIDLQAWEEFQQHRRDIRKPLSELGYKKNMNVLEKNKTRQKEIVDRTIANGWKGLFPPDHKRGRDNKKPKRENFDKRTYEGTPADEIDWLNPEKNPASKKEKDKM